MMPVTTLARLHSGRSFGVVCHGRTAAAGLRDLDINYDITPGVPAFAAAAAALGTELTLPGVAQSLVLTRTSGRASGHARRRNA